MKPSPRALIAACALAALPAHSQEVAVYDGPCDASAAVALDAEHFVVANDENNTLFVYRRGSAAAVARWPLDAFLGTGGKEADLEGAATVGTRSYWISSHGRNKNAKERPERYRFFATDIDAGQQPPGVTPAGTPYTRLLADLLAADTLAPYALADAAQRAPEAPGGLNIEGLAALPGGRLLIGLRNPVPQGKALLVPLDNPAQLIAGTAPARFGAPITLDLGGRGVRSIERVGNGYLIVAGPPADAGGFALYRWSGQAADAPLALPLDFKDLRPEALFALPGSDKVQIVSDDGGIETQGVACKDRDATQQKFRSILVKP
jgi:hypothetical protein